MFLKRRWRRQESSEHFLECDRRAPRTFCCTITWAKSTAPSGPGDSCAAAPALFPTRLPPPRAKREQKYARRLLWPRSSFRMARRGASFSKMATRSRQKLFPQVRSEEHTSELQSRSDLVCRLLLEKKKK